MILAHMGVSMNREPLHRPQNPAVLIVGIPETEPLNFLETQTSLTEDLENVTSPITKPYENPS